MSHSTRPVGASTFGNLSGVWTFGLAKAFADIGLDLEFLCVKAGLDVGALTDPRGRLPRDWAGRLWRAALGSTQDPFLGLHAAQAWEPRANHLVFLLFLSAERLGLGLQGATRYQSLLARGDAVVTLDSENDFHLIQVNRVADQLPISDNQIEYLAGIVVKMIQFATGGQFQAREIRFDHPCRGGLEHYAALFACPVVFEASRTELVVDEQSWQLPLLHGNYTLHEQLAEMAVAEYATLGQTQLADMARDCLRLLLPKGDSGIDATAAVLRMTPRTLQRRLREEGTSFRAVLDEARRAIVLEGVAHKQSLEDLGRAAGFTNIRSFKRAMRRWGIRPLNSDVSVS
jgi:AraC-like DNA-binding protein